jgi:hypothetical protein
LMSSSMATRADWRPPGQLGHYPTSRSRKPCYGDLRF